MIGNGWDDLLKEQWQKDYFIKLNDFLDEEYKTQTVFPPKEKIFEALSLSDYKDVKVVILGQDPYHGYGEAHGLSFSVQDGVKIPPSLRNIFKELENEGEVEIPKSGNLTKWANQGVLLLNTVLTVRENSANSHKKKGWELFTDYIISTLNQKEESVVFLLWGANAHSKEKLITNKNHLILKAVHPSPLSVYRGFFGCDHFKLANEFLEKNNLKKIDWQL